jgi:hypothetical protein
MDVAMVIARDSSANLSLFENVADLQHRARHVASQIIAARRRSLDLFLDASTRNCHAHQRRKMFDAFMRMSGVTADDYGGGCRRHEQVGGFEMQVRFLRARRGE